MELIELKDKICNAFTGSKSELDEILEIIENDEAAFPFNKYEHLICQLIEKGGFKYDDYIAIRDEYMRQNPYLHLFEHAPRSFGEKFAESYIQEKCSKIKEPSKILDQNYDGEYNLWLDDIKIEVGASRAAKAGEGPHYTRALSYKQIKTGARFDMNFQQLKPHCCDVFIFVAVFRDEIISWILSSKEVEESEFYSRQHRDGIEGQIHIKHNNIELFNDYKLKGDNIEKAIRDASKRN